MTLGWLQIFRLGLVQLCIGAVVVLTTSTLNRLMVVELALPAVLPGALVALHYGLQIARPAWGLRSDTKGNRTFFVILGMAVLALGAFLAAVAVVLFPLAWGQALLLSVFAYVLIGFGVGASGTSLLALLASATEPRRRAAAATITWLLMIFGIAVTAGTVGHFLDPYSPERLLWIVAIVTLGAVVLTTLAVWGIERRLDHPVPEDTPPRLLEGLREVWAEPQARAFTFFLFLSMTAYFLQELILEPYAGLVFGFTAGETTKLSGMQNGGVFFGMLTVGLALSGLKIGSLRGWVVTGCLGSSLALMAIVALGHLPGAALVPAVIGLGFFNGIFAVAAIGAMMALAGEGRSSREGTRMGLWGAAQAIAAGFGGLVGAGAADLMRLFLPDATAFGLVFGAQALLFIVAAMMATGVVAARGAARVPTVMAGE
ncbi:BCD family MFS transporter [Rhodobacter capsulatus]|jgi:BCD family chlorophyll transporter-like MFS transporter|uniref:Bacteriochlorophyll synthase 44.5 kDa chain n=1 Tax=Rhodobacter capsulatus (strain ATCC BAA-309 / NBRC 16581 / SB1003) TaxID=272942 RepID=BCH2_RHOCB|nr:BCD family MFS transporter [Rhodobacter capsulatus]P26171.1 RecName: Full=Bacteriochlorophyll synthase 44.5 kDa chain [Rhodobacter capsulatus SB 1003]ADE84437.1 PUCC family protein [Rhodobacter capsulatus SB 1003]ETD02777.1 bacteriochlorophyll synthase [Rhodobacter capsulatus DE442]ETD78934.1 bacteriochlorophyll synthase [Rhodobacter capsulatus R121]ETD87629.1 bacteriochlorophyll synthase [Rhodobacter capsulatus B6]ETE54913.1 bacteriochlorophyll synthase [Rhodobacter capsulatus Y262]